VGSLPAYTPGRPGATPPPTALGELTGQLSPGQVLVPPEDLARYETDVLGRRGSAAWVARPRDTAEVRRVVQWAYRHRASFVVQGANTGPVRAGIPDASGHQGVLSTELCRGTLVIDAVDRTVTVSAGIDLATLNEALAEHHLTLPIDLGANPTIGGMVGANTGGARLIRHGDVRRHVLGLEVVLPDEAATVLPLQRGLRKDNRGPDVKQLFVGSSGTLGVVTMAVLSVDLLPRQSAVALVEPVTDSAMVELLTLLEHRHGEQVTAFEMLSRGALEAIARHRTPDVRWPFGSELPPDVILLVELSSSDAAGSIHRDFVDSLTETIEVARQAGHVANAWFGPPQQLWALRHMAINAIMGEGALVAFDLSTTRSALVDLRRQARDLVAHLAPGTRCIDFGHVGDGGLHLVVIWPDAGKAADREVEQRAVHDAVYDLVESLGGTSSAEHGIGPENIDALRRHTPQGLWNLQRACKAMCDPLDLLGSLTFGP